MKPVMTFRFRAIWICVNLVLVCIGTAMIVHANSQVAPKSIPDDPPQVEALTTAKLQIIGLQQQVELVTAQLDICKGALAPQSYKERASQFDQVVQTLVKEYETAHPGWTLDLKTGKAAKKGSQ